MNRFQPLFKSLTLWVAASMFVLAILPTDGRSALPQIQPSPSDQDSYTFQFELKQTGVTVSLRGLCVVDQNVVWSSGSEGTILRSVDAGETWSVFSIDHRSTVDFRDIHGFDADHAIVMTAGQPAEFWETVDGGLNWAIVLEDKRPTAFFDGMVISSGGFGLGFGDVIDGQFPVVRRSTTGKWSMVDDQESLRLPSSIHGYAASGTSICQFGKSGYLIGTGGKVDGHENQCLVLRTIDEGANWTKTYCPIPAGESSGIFSTAALGDWVVAVGGDYLKPAESAQVAAFSKDGGMTWEKATTNPSGFRSAVAGVRVESVANEKGSSFWMCIGTNGADYSIDGGKTWRVCRKLNSHTLEFVRPDINDASYDPDTLWAWTSGPKGGIYRILIQKK